MVSEVCYMGLVEAGRALAARKLSSVELTKAVLDRIAALDPKLHAYATLTRRSGAGAGAGPPMPRSPPAACAGRCMACRSR